ncbi:MAG: hypothetical protein HY318_02210 [Armatimonadetes bacterium]|nr:hypothetical protein [Armatimonadota bacterium]
MLQCVEGIYREGQVELLEKPAQVKTARVFVTFVPNEEVDLQARGIGPEEAAERRWRLGAIAEDWCVPE